MYIVFLFVSLAFIGCCQWKQRRFKGVEQTLTGIALLTWLFGRRRVSYCSRCPLQSLFFFPSVLTVSKRVLQIALLVRWTGKKKDKSYVWQKLRTLRSSLSPPYLTNLSLNILLFYFEFSESRDCRKTSISQDFKLKTTFHPHGHASDQVLQQVSVGGGISIGPPLLQQTCTGGRGLLVVLILYQVLSVSLGQWNS